MISARCVACDLHTFAHKPLEHACLDSSQRSEEIIQKSRIVPCNVIIIIIIKWVSLVGITWHSHSHTWRPSQMGTVLGASLDILTLTHKGHPKWAQYWGYLLDTLSHMKAIPNGHSTGDTYLTLSHTWRPSQMGTVLGIPTWHSLSHPKWAQYWGHLLDTHSNTWKPSQMGTVLGIPTWHSLSHMKAIPNGHRTWGTYLTFTLTHEGHPKWAQDLGYLLDIHSHTWRPSQMGTVLGASLDILTLTHKCHPKWAQYWGYLLDNHSHTWRPSQMGTVLGVPTWHSLSHTKAIPNGYSTWSTHLTLTLTHEGHPKWAQYWGYALDILTLTHEGHPKWVQYWGYALDILTLTHKGHPKWVQYWGYALDILTLTHEGHPKWVQYWGYALDILTLTHEDHPKWAQYWGYALDILTLTHEGHPKWAQYWGYALDSLSHMKANPNGHSTGVMHLTLSFSHMKAIPNGHSTGGIPSGHKAGCMLTDVQAIPRPHHETLSHNFSTIPNTVKIVWQNGPRTHTLPYSIFHK